MSVRCDVADGVATITIDRPERRNALTFAMLERLTELAAEAHARDDVRAIVLTGVPGAFCAGIDLGELDGRDAGDRGGDGGSDGLVLLRSDKPVVAAIDGPAYGLGAELTLQCDLRIATPRARFAWNFVRVGLVPDTGLGSWLLPRVVGLARAYELLLDGGALAAERAVEIGYVTALVEPDQLAAAAQDRARSLAQHSPFAMRRVKRLVRDGLERSLDDHLAAHRVALAECFASADHAEGVAAFLERRPPRFTGEERG